MYVCMCGRNETNAYVGPKGEMVPLQGKTIQLEATASGSTRLYALRDGFS
jgi:hypothetical protein